MFVANERGICLVDPDEDKMKTRRRKRWLPLESNPDVMNNYMHKLGLPASFGFHDILSFEDWALQMVPRPALAVLLLFPMTKANSEFRKEQELDLTNRRGELELLEQGLFFTKQYVPNACGTIGLMHAVLNAMKTGMVTVKEGAWLDRLLKAIEAGSGESDDIGAMLEEDEELEVAHGEGAAAGQSNQPSEVNLHFICFVHHNGYLFELDGTKKWPVCHGDCTPATLLRSAIDTVKSKFVALDPANPNFNLIALASSEDPQISSAMGGSEQGGASADPVLVMQLVSMGFGQEASEQAVLLSGNANADVALDYGLTHGLFTM
jgi:ubiquitin carboxyl-terminal hydrolase L3